MLPACLACYNFVIIYVKCTDHHSRSHDHDDDDDDDDDDDEEEERVFQRFSKCSVLCRTVSTTSSLQSF